MSVPSSPPPTTALLPLSALILPQPPNDWPLLQSGSLHPFCALQLEGLSKLQTQPRPLLLKTSNSPWMLPRSHFLLTLFFFYVPATPAKAVPNFTPSSPSACCPPQQESASGHSLWKPSASCTHRYTPLGTTPAPYTSLSLPPNQLTSTSIGTIVSA